MPHYLHVMIACSLQLSFAFSHLCIYYCMPLYLSENISAVQISPDQELEKFQYSRHVAVWIYVVTRITMLTNKCISNQNS